MDERLIAKRARARTRTKMESGVRAKKDGKRRNAKRRSERTKWVRRFFLYLTESLIIVGRKSATKVHQFRTGAKYGIISDVEYVVLSHWLNVILKLLLAYSIFTKNQEFYTWLVEERKINPRLSPKINRKKNFLVSSRTITQVRHTLRHTSIH